MASIHGLKRRITAAQNVSKTTRAMQMIAASKLKKAQEATLASRPYVEKLVNVTKRVVRCRPADYTHPYITPKNAEGKKLLLVFAPDKGLCGGLITNLLREFLHYQRQEKNVKIMTIGKKVESTVLHLQSEVVAAFLFGTTTPAFDMVYPITKIINEQYLLGSVSSVHVLSTHFTSIFSQKPKLTSILPIEITLEDYEDTKQEYTFEPNVKELLSPLLNHYIEMVVYQKLLESFVSEQAARMVAMQNATSNAKDIIEDLRLEYNKTRQARITNEILDISGASAAMEIYE